MFNLSGNMGYSEYLWICIGLIRVFDTIFRTGLEAKNFTHAYKYISVESIFIK